MKRVLALAAMLCLGLGPAQAQDRPEVFTQLGHSDAVLSVAYAPGGRVLASGGDDHTVKLWDVTSGRELRTLRGHTNHVASVAFSPDGRLLASGDTNDTDTVKLWDVASGRELRTLRGHSVAFSPDGRMLAAGGWDNWIKLYDVASGRELRTLRGHSKSVNAVAFSPDGHVLASASSDDTIRLWDVASGRELRTLHVYALSVAFSPDGRVLASGNLLKTVTLWDVASGRELLTLSGHSDHVNSVVYSPDGRTLVSGSRDGTMKLWDAASGREVGTLRGPSTGVSSVAYSPDGHSLASASGAMIKLWDVASARELNSLRGYSRPVASVAFSPDGRLLASGSHDHTITLWDAASGRAQRTLLGHSDKVNSVAFSPDGRILASGSWDHQLKLWEVASGRELRTVNVFDQNVESVAFSPDGRVVAAGSYAGGTQFYDVASGQQLRSGEFSMASMVYSIAFSPDGRVLAVGQKNDYGFPLVLWDVASARKRTPRVNSNSVSSVAFSRDGRVLASGNLDHTINLWDVASGRALRALRGQGDTYVHSVAFSPDGRILASSSDDRTIKFWDVASGRMVRTLSGHASEVFSVAFSPDGKLLASASADGSVRLWDASSGSEKLSFVAFADGSSLAMTPEGYYDSSSAAAEQNINVRIGDRVFPVAAYREKFYRPDLVKLSLAGNSLQGLGFTAIDNVKAAPTVELVDVPASAGDQKLAVNLRITDGGGGIGLVRLFVNGTAVVQDDQSHLAPAASHGAVTRSYTVQLAGGANELRAVAFNADDSMQSNPALASVSLRVTPRATLHAVVVGIQEFKNPSLKLGYSVADAQLFADTLQKYAAPLFKGTPDIRLLVTPAETTRERLIKTLTDMHDAVGADDLFVFYVASHGLADNGQYFLVTSNVGSLSTEHLKSDAISKEDLTQLISNIAATKKLMVIDTCHAGALGNALQASLMTRGLDETTALKILSRAIGTTVLAASTSVQQALEGYRGHGLFTYVVTDGLSGRGDIDKSGFVTTLGLAHYVDDQVPNLAEQHFKRAQYPTIETNGQAFPLTKVR